eukprot:gb/GECG01010757.1/.p1 GENE.gb/GECG01010757.1/~~gb/GECG01010757.1/.p1  ORF type:complete len:701 (+),score=59.54 gb/GECG01010757.1/:1-2103(+)
MKEEAKPTNKEDNGRLRKIFESIDENGDGKLSPEEVRRFISADETPTDGSRSSNATGLTPASANRLHKGSTGAPHREGEAEGRELDEETATRMIEVLDQDKDGTIDYTEFKRAFEDVEGQLTKERLRIVWLQRSKSNVDFSGNDFSSLLPGGSISLDINSFRLFLAGGLGGLVSRTATAPIERVRLLQQTRGSSFGSAKYILESIIYQQGIRGLWQGNLANCLKAIPQSALVCAVYGSSVAALEAYSDDSDVAPASRLAVGALAGAFATTCTYPLDVIRAKLAVQLQDHGNGGKGSESIRRAATAPKPRHSILHHRDLWGSNTPSALPVASRIRPKGSDYLLRARFRRVLHIARIDDVVKAVTFARSIDSRRREGKVSPRSLWSIKRLFSKPLISWWKGFEMRMQPRYSAQRTPANALSSSASPPLNRIPTRYQNRINPTSFSKSSLLNGTNVGRLRRGCVRPLCFSYVFPLSARCRGLVPVHPHIVHSSASTPHQTYPFRILQYFRLANTKAEFLSLSNDPNSLVRLGNFGIAQLGGRRVNATAPASDQEYKGILDTCRKVFKNEGYSGLFRGIRPTLVGMTTFIAIQQAGFDVFVEWFHRMVNQEQQNAASTLVASAVAGTMAQTVVHPVDTIRRRIQVAKVRSARKLGFWDISRYVISQHGWRGFYAGLLSTYGKVVPSITISLTVREIVLGRLQWS